MTKNSIRQSKFVWGTNCFGGQIGPGGQIVLGGLLYRRHFVSGSFCPRWLFDREAYGPVAFIRGFSLGAFYLEPRSVVLFRTKCVGPEHELSPVQLCDFVKKIANVLEVNKKIKSSS